jgi:sigma-B regulation protein RsbU (phosphoserine phosphatase)
LRIDPEGERIGLNVAEHGASTEILDLLTEMDDQRRAGDFSRPVSVEPHTEVGQIAQQYNRVLANINAEQRQREAVTEALRQQTVSLQLLRKAAAAANRAKSVEDAIRTSLESICAFGGWSIGHCFMVDEAIKKLISSKIWHLDDEERYSVFREVTEKSELMSGAGLCSLVLASGEPNWIADVSKDKNFSRAAAAKEIGIKGGAAFPVQVGDDVVAVLEFFSGEPKAPDETILEVMGAVGTQLGRVVERGRSEAARFKSVVDNMPAHVHLRDRSGRFILVNRQYEEFYGVTNDFVRGKTIREISTELKFDISPDENEAFDRQVIETDRIVELEFDVTRDGELHNLSDVKFPIKDHSGQIIAVGGIELDVTERKKAAEALRESEERFRTLVANLPGIVYRGLVDADWTMQFISEAVVDITGYPATDFIDNRVRSYGSIIHPDDQEMIARTVDESVEQGEPFTLEYRILDAGGHMRWVYEKGLVVVDDDGTPLWLDGTIYDITDRKHTEEQLKIASQIIKDQRDRMEDELNIGREIQMSMIPLVFPPFPDHDEFSVFAALEPAREIGGDFYDYYFIDEERFCFCIGDVSGKGVPAALFMAVAKTLIKSRAADDRSTASILTHVNDELSVNNTSCMFVTIFSGILNIRTGELLYTNAGHNPPYLKRKDGTLQILDQRHGPIIGAVEGMVYAEGRDTMEPGDLLLLYTDGVTEAMDVDDRLFSENRLQRLLTAMDTDDVNKVVVDTVVAVMAFEGKAEQADDITVLALAFHGAPEGALSAERQITIKNRMPEIAAVIEAFEAFAEEFGVPLPIAMKFSLVFDDILNNAISYAYHDNDAHDIEVKMELAGERLIVTITDDGVPFNPLSVAAPRTDLALEDREAGGLGIHLVRNLVDDVTYQRRIDKNVLTLMSNLQQKDSAA